MSIVPVNRGMLSSLDDLAGKASGVLETFRPLRISIANRLWQLLPISVQQTHSKQRDLIDFVGKVCLVFPRPVVSLKHAGVDNEEQV